jgi:cytochrome c oxidase subunit I+III
MIMQLYCIARRAAGRMTGRYDIDISNVTLYWHFVVITATTTVAVVALFPLLQ